MNLVFEVIDVACEQADQGFFVPQVTMTTKSTTQFAILHGYSEFIASTPPKKYRKATLQGTSQRIGFTCEQTPRMAAGAQYVWSGFGEFDLNGVQTASYSKKFFAQCAKQFWPLVPLQANPSAISPSGHIPPTQFVGYCFPSDPRSCPVCDPNIVNWPFIGEQATGELVPDLAGFLRTQGITTTTPTSFSVNGQVFGFTDIGSPPHQTTATGVFYTVQVGSTTFQAEGAITNPPTPFPVVYINSNAVFIEGAYLNFVDANSYSAVLSEEYTDADALANAQIQVGTGATAATTPRTTGFVSVFTNVVYTLVASNLIVGKDYTVTVDLWEQGPGVNTHTPKQYSFNAGASMNTIVDIIPTPIATHTITVNSPKIAFSF